MSFKKIADSSRNVEFEGFGCVYIHAYVSHPQLESCPQTPEILQLLRRKRIECSRHIVVVQNVVWYQARIQDSEGGGGFVHSEGGGGFLQEFQERIQIVARPWANQQAKKNCRTCIRAWVYIYMTCHLYQ